MPRLIPTFQTSVDDRQGNIFLITKVVPVSKKDWVALPRQTGQPSTLLMVYGSPAPNTPALQDGSTSATGSCTFYVNSGGDAQIQNGSIGTEYTIVSRHNGTLNYTSTTAARVA